ncbi:MAG: hypothetical protein D6791_00525 [Chloroflexi bacterium]|nr:MAG: hypothetical protein D6791_00525 [Chloroflexota bacterium]
MWKALICATDDDGGTGCDGLPVTVRYAADLTAAFVTAEPAASVALTARVRNNGGAQVPAGVSISFYADGTLIGTTATAQALDPVRRKWSPSPGRRPPPATTPSPLSPTTLRRACILNVTEQGPYQHE